MNGDRPTVKRYHFAAEEVLSNRRVGQCRGSPGWGCFFEEIFLWIVFKRIQ